MGKLFGTDGVRGIAGRDLDARLAISVAAAAAVVLGKVHAADEAAATRAGRPRAVVGRDPRASGEFLEAAVVAGLAGSGVDVLRLGVVPTPAVAYLTGLLDADLGVMLSASHNPAPDNGIKFFASAGLKLADEVEDEIEAQIAQLADRPAEVPPGGFGRVADATGESARYLEHLLSTVGVFADEAAWRDEASPTARRQARPELPLAGLRVIVDCAHGASYQLAPKLLRAAGADVTAIGVEPDGLNINSGCGSTSLGALRSAVIAHEADAGVAYDGDADRCLAVDAEGEVVDGDQILAMLALALKESGRLAGNTVVATVMANLGFRQAMQRAGIDVVETPVGDRYLIAAMLDGKFLLGGEQSGHLIMLDHASTGDGMLTSLHLLATVAARGRPLSELAAVMTKYPQVLVNVRGVDKARVAVSAAGGELSAMVIQAQTELASSGRVLVRPSGTEPAVRVMVEAIEESQAKRIAERLAGVVRRVGGVA